MADYVWPDDLQPYAMSFYLQHHTTVFESPFTRQQQVLGRSASRWVARLSFRGGAGGQIRSQHNDGARIEALLAQIKGPQKTVSLYDFRRPERGGEYATFDDYAETIPETFFSDGTDFDDETGFIVTPTGAPSNGMVSAGSRSVTLTGYWPGTSPNKIGDYIGVGDGTPHIITSVEPADSNGRLVVSFERPARVTYYGAVSFSKVPGTFRLVSDDASENPTDVDGMASYELEFIEALT